MQMLWFSIQSYDPQARLEMLDKKTLTLGKKQKQKTMR